MPPFVPHKRRRSQTPRPAPQRYSDQPASSSQKTKKARASTLSDEHGSAQKSTSTLEDNKAFLQEQWDDEDEESSGSSDLDSDAFENAMPEPATKRRKIEQIRSPTRRSKNKMSDSENDESDEDDMEWEDATRHSNQEPTISGDLNLTLDEVPQHSTSAFTDPHGQKKGPSKIERSIRTNTHCMHVQHLLFHNLIRNWWVCDKDVQKSLVDELPPGILKEVERFRKASGIVDQGKKSNEYVKTPSKGMGKAKRSVKEYKNQRDWGRHAKEPDEEAPALSAGDPTLRLMKVLCSFWSKKFTVSAPGLRKQGYKDLARLEQELKSLRNENHDPEEHGERVRSLEEFRQLAKSSTGSRDVGAQLFTALLRGVGLETRLVHSLQPLGFGWSKNEEALPPKEKSKFAKQAVTEKPSMEKSEIDPKATIAPVKPKRKDKPSSIVAQKHKTHVGGDRSQPIAVSDDSSDLSEPPNSDDDNDDDDDDVLDITPSDLKLSTKRYDRDLPFPIYWTEVLSPISQRWIPVDAIVNSLVVAHPDQLAQFEPRGARADKAKQIFAYVVAFSLDGTAKDVTVRYLKRHRWPGKTKGVRMPVERLPIYNKHGKIKQYEEYDWFKNVMRCLSRSSEQRTPADEIEDVQELQPVRVTRDAAKAGEETLQGYKSSAEFVLGRHLRREEALRPNAKQVKTFTTGKGDKAKTEPVYLRKDVVTCRTTESWHKQGREVKDGEQALKFVPIRAVTTIRKREIEEAERETGEKQKQGLYAWDQTDWIIPPPIKDGVIPKNAFGNMDLYAPTMVPSGAVHVPLRGTAKVCRKLQIDYAEACTGFEFGNRMAVPILTGVVVAEEHEDAVIDAWEAEMENKRKKEQEKTEKIALGMWKKMLAGLRVIERVRNEYGDEAESRVDAELRRSGAHKGSAKKVTVARRSNMRDTTTTKKDDEEGETGIFEQANFAAAARGGGGFLTEDDLPENFNDAGFQTQQDDDAQEEIGGGFVLEARSEKVENSVGGLETPKSYLRTPRSLEPVVEKERNISKEAVEQATEADGNNITTARESATQSRRSGESEKHSSRKPSTLDSVTIVPESANKDSLLDSDVEPNLRKTAKLKPDKEPIIRVTGRRNAGRKTASATRSQYFEADTDDEVDSSDVITRKKTSTQ